MSLPVNGERGEVPLSIGGHDIVIAATMQGLAALSTRLGCASMSDLFQRLANVEVNAAMAAIELLTIRGDAKAALGALKLGHFTAVAGALSQALAHHFDGDEGNDEAAGEK